MMNDLKNFKTKGTKVVKQENAITLIALVITIIVLLILAGISISMLAGDNGILQRTTDAKTETEKGQEKEIVALAYNSALAKKLSNGDSTAVTAEDMNTELTNQGATASGDNPIIVIFTISNRQYTVNNGIVNFTDSPVGNGLEGLSSAEVSLLPAGVTEKTIENISNDNLKDSTKIKAVITDSDNGEVPIPKGANYKEGTESTGLVIEYKGSEFVWVPINSDLTAKGTNKKMAKVSAETGFSGTDSEGRINYEGILYDFVDDSGEYGVVPYNTSRVKSSYGQGTSDYREPDLLSDYDIDDLTALKTNSGNNSLTQTYLSSINLTQTSFWKEIKEGYNAMIESVSKYGGFFVGRYETSIDATTTVASKKGTPMSAETNNQMWYGMYDKQKQFSSSSDVLQSTMIYGSQYDAMLNWMQEGVQGEKINQTTNADHTWTNSNATITGGTDTDIINNIYDLEGNLYEWTLEAYSTYSRAIRGGSFYTTHSPSERGYYTYGPDENYKWLGSRLSLYIQ